jgi:hypothetical protein
MSDTFRRRASQIPVDELRPIWEDGEVLLERIWSSCALIRQHTDPAPEPTPESERAANRIKWGLDAPTLYTDEEAEALGRAMRWKP